MDCDWIHFKLYIKCLVMDVVCLFFRFVIISCVFFHEFSIEFRVGMFFHIFCIWNWHPNDDAIGGAAVLCCWQMFYCNFHIPAGPFVFWHFLFARAVAGATALVPIVIHSKYLWRHWPFALNASSAHYWLLMVRRWRWQQWRRLRRLMLLLQYDVHLWSIHCRLSHSNWWHTILVLDRENRNRHWMENAVQRPISRHESDCDWSIGFRCGIAFCIWCTATRHAHDAYSDVDPNDFSYQMSCHIDRTQMDFPLNAVCVCVLWHFAVSKTYFGNADT